MPQFEHQNHSYLYLDIETKSHGEPNFEELKTLQEFKNEMCKSKKELRKDVPKSYKSEKQIEDWIFKTYEKNKEKALEAYTKQIEEYDIAFRKKALNSLESDLVCIGLAFNDSEPYIVEYNEDEMIMLQDMVNWIKQNVPEKDIYTMIWVGQSVLNFDILRIWHRAIKHQMKELMDWLPVEKWSKRVEDINDMFNAHLYGKYNSLNDIGIYLGVGGKGDVDGAAVHDLFLAGKLNDIYNYCGNGDIRKTRMIHRMLHCQPQLESDIKNVK